MQRQPSTAAFDASRFKMEDLPDAYMCPICYEPAIPFAVAVPCGHSACSVCLERVSVCPQCRVPIQARTLMPQQTSHIQDSIRYSCVVPKCTWTGTAAQRGEHRCDPRYNRFRDLVPSLEEAAFVEVLARFDGRSDDQTTDALLVAYGQQEDDAARARPVASTVASAAAAGGRPKRAIVLWDYDNINPSRIRLSVTAFVAKLGEYFERSMRIMDSKCWEVHAYIVVGRDYGPAIEHLTKMQVDVHVCSAKREAADRELANKMRAIAREIAADRSQASKSIVIISDDGDFIKDVKEARDTYQVDIHVVHAAPAGSDHAARHAMYATSAVSITAAVPEYGRSAELRLTDPRATVRVAGTNVLVSQLIWNRGVKLLLESPEIDGAWCRNLGPHIVDKCKFIHPAHGGVPQQSQAQAAAAAPQPQPQQPARGATSPPHAPPAPSASSTTSAATYPAGTSTINVEGRPVEVALVEFNHQVRQLLQHPEWVGRWCDLDHPAADCKLVHSKRVKAGAISVSCRELIMNPGLRRALDLPHAPAGFCGGCVTPETCGYLHRRPTGGASMASVAMPPVQPAVAAGSRVAPAAAPAEPTMRVADQDVPVSHIFPNLAKEALASNPHFTGRWCTNFRDHDVGACTFIHSAMIKIQGVDTHVSRVLDNAARRYLLCHGPTKEGRWCTRADAHNVKDCTFCHRF